jgi:hypothetical protein
MELPNARVVRQAGVLVAPPRVRRRWPKVRVREAVARVGRGIGQGFGIAVAMWPLTAVLLLGIVAIWAIGAHSTGRP